MGGKPTGRFSNGRVPSDIIGEGFGLKKILPAYLDPNLQLQDLLTGVCFASAGSGYDRLTARSQVYTHTHTHTHHISIGLVVENKNKSLGLFFEVGEKRRKDKFGVDRISGGSNER
ncbi:putative SGNH hydrolase-type esterase domain-containing protein [Rosa chinensis]|uniref:Putative SGNH hydrolase-type esterase domain-containing protein n=1 Tax=Rosa chinensis TaxID=74649 RepID=A0A2P6RLT3_ROSCH|nr:putative SGNH hydrolase-type esterase domain-containing protein [Rosa chinensis]